jgi:hypothetical protein
MQSRLEKTGGENRRGVNGRQTGLFPGIHPGPHRSLPLYFEAILIAIVAYFFTSLSRREKI